MQYDWFICDPIFSHNDFLVVLAVECLLIKSTKKRTIV